MGWPKWNWNDWRAITDVSHVRGAVRGYTKSASSGPLAVHIFSNCWKPVRIPRPVYYRSSLYGRHTPHKLRFDIAFSPNSNFSFTMLSPKRCIWILSQTEYFEQTADGWRVSAFANLSMVCSTCGINANHAHSMCAPACRSREWRT